MFASFYQPRLNSFLKGDRAAIIALTAVFFGVNWPLLTGQVSEHWDGADQFAPFYTLLARMTRSGHFLLWNPFSTGGSPDFAEPQLGAFSPVMLLFGLIFGPSSASFHFYWLSIWLLGGLGMYVLARALATPPWGALATSLGFVFSGYYLGHAEHISLIYSYSFLPWVLWRVRAAMVEKRVWPACEAGALWGLSALAGNPAITIPSTFFIGIIALAWLPEQTGVSRLTRWRPYLTAMGCLAVVGGIVLAPTYLGFRHEVAGYSHRNLPLPRADVLDQPALALNWLTSLADPVLPLVTFHLDGWSHVDISYVPVYFGAMMPVFALFALWTKRASGRAWVIAGTALLFLGFTLGNTLPLREWLYNLLPPTRYFRHAPMFRGFFMMAVAILAASGTASVAERLRRPTESGRNLRPLALIAVVCAVASIVAFDRVYLTVPVQHPEMFSPLAFVHLTVAWVGLAGLCMAAVRWPAARRYAPGALVVLAILDLGGAHSLTQSVAFAPVPSRVRAAPTLPLLELGSAGFSRDPRVWGNVNLYAQRPTFVNYTAMLNRLYVAWGEDPLLLASVTGPERVWFAPAAPTVPATPEVFDAFQRRVDTLRDLIVLRHERAGLIEPHPAPASGAVLEAVATAPPADLVPCDVRAYRANDLTLNVTCPSAGFVLLTDRWSRSWTATVNGHAVSVDGGDFLFRLVPVSAGENLVRMTFHLPWLFPLVTLSWVTMAVVAVGSLWNRWRRKKTARSAMADHVPVAMPDAICVSA